MQSKHTEKRIEKIKVELQEIGEMRPGSLNQQYNACGKQNCRCKDANNPKKHGPYYQLSYVHQGKSTSQFIPKALVKQVEEQLANYKNFRVLMSEWVDLALKQAKENLQADKLRLAEKPPADRRSKSRGRKTGNK